MDMQWLSGAHDLALPQSASYMERAKNCSYPDVTPLSWMVELDLVPWALGFLSWDLET